MSKIMVVVRNTVKIPSISGSTLQVDTETKSYENAEAINNERGELIIHQSKKTSAGWQEIGTVAVFKEWMYWEKQI